MTNKTRKHIWPVALMSLAVFGVLVAVVALSVLPTRAAQAHGCDTGTAQQQAQCDTEHENAGLDHTDPDHSHDPDPGNGMTDDDAHASMPTAYALQALDNGARLDWDAPDDVATGAEVVGYRIHRDAWNTDPMHPINRYGDAAFNHISRGGSDTDYSDLGLSYETVYSYQVQAIVEYDVEHWWNNLNCVQMNDVVKPGSDEPQVGADTAGTAPYCVMYDDLSTAAKAVVQRAYDRYDEMYPTKTSYDRYALGELSMMRTIETADSGGRLQALLDAPTAVRDLELSTSCADSIVVSWSEPMDFGTVPAVDDNGVYVGPDYIGGRRAGKEEVGEDATSVTYHVQRMVNDGSWADVTASGMSYTDTNVAYDNTYKYRVRAMNVAGLYSPWTMVSDMLVVPPGVNAPSNLRATLNEDGEVVLQWTAPQGGNQEWFVGDDSDTDVNNGDLSERLSYRIERVDDNDGTTMFSYEHEDGSVEHDEVHRKHQYGPRSFDTPRITHEQTLTDPTPYDGEATYVVTALVNACLPSEGNSVTLDTRIEEPGAPGNVSAAASGNMITVTWSAPADAGSLGDREATITGYNVERSTTSGSGFEPVEPSHSGTGTSYTDMGLDYSTTYYYRVTAVNSFGAQSAMSAEDSATTAAEMLGMATNLRVGLNTGGAIQVTWNAAQNAAGYIVIAIDKDDTDSAISGVVNVGPAGLLTTFNLSGLTSGSGYYVYVAATGTANDNTLSEPVEVTAN